MPPTVPEPTCRGTPNHPGRDRAVPVPPSGPRFRHESRLIPGRTACFAFPPMPSPADPPSPGNSEVPPVTEVVLDVSVRDLTPEDLRWCAWSGTPLHLTQVARELERAKAG